MSAPDPEKWKVTEDELDGLNGLRYGTGSDCIKVAQAVARRRALEELRAMVGETCELCRTDAPFVRNAAGSGIGGHPCTDGHGYFVCTDLRLRNRIAEIEAEEA